jgi:hypothetical protein
MSKQFNGWTNNATWRVTVDILGNIEFNGYVTADELREIVEDVVFSNVQDDRKLCVDYANAFISQVNFYEIAELINEEFDFAD